MQRVCSLCKGLGHTKRTCRPPFVPLSQPHVHSLELMKRVFENELAQRALVKLYSDSQSECMRNGTIGMEIGMAREKDQVTLLQSCLGSHVNLCIDNTEVEDCTVCSEKVSIKHSSGTVGSPVKAKWTSADKSVQEAIDAMIDADEEYYPHLLVTYIDVDAKTLTIICIAKSFVRSTIKELQAAAFTVPKGNSRGIEYSRQAMGLLLDRRYFTVQIKDASVAGGDDPIDRRKKRLEALGLLPQQFKDLPSNEVP